jgi:hypothetical protein
MKELGYPHDILKQKLNKKFDGPDHLKDDVMKLRKGYLRKR